MKENINVCDTPICLAEDIEKIMRQQVYKINQREDGARLSEETKLQIARDEARHEMMRLDRSNAHQIAFLREETNELERRKQIEHALETAMQKLLSELRIVEDQAATNQEIRRHAEASKAEADLYDRKSGTDLRFALKSRQNQHDHELKMARINHEARLKRLQTILDGNNEIAVRNHETRARIIEMMAKRIIDRR